MDRQRSSRYYNRSPCNCKIPTTYAGAYISALKQYGKKCDTCIIGTDADVEGCNIGLMDAIPFVKQANPQIKLAQLWLNDLQKDNSTSFQPIDSSKMVMGIFW